MSKSGYDYRHLFSNDEAGQALYRKHVAETRHYTRVLVAETMELYDSIAAAQLASLVKRSSGCSDLQALDITYQSAPELYELRAAAIRLAQRGGPKHEILRCVAEGKAAAERIAKIASAAVVKSSDPARAIAEVTRLGAGKW